MKSREKAENTGASRDIRQIDRKYKKYLKICETAHKQSENYVKQNYDLLKRAYGEGTYLAISRKVILGSSKDELNLAKRFVDLKKFPEPITIKKLEDFINEQSCGLESP